MTCERFTAELFAKSERSNDLTFILNAFYDDTNDGLVGLPDEGRPTRPP
jgi:hypothetical protein